MSEKSVYVVLARRWGNHESHTYLVGVYAKKHAAMAARDAEVEWRGGKYDCDIIEAPVEKSWENDHRWNYTFMSHPYVPGDGPSPRKLLEAS